MRLEDPDLFPSLMLLRKCRNAQLATSVEDTKERESAGNGKLRDFGDAYTEGT